jgi:ABC-2 type transport system permease protein
VPTLLLLDPLPMFDVELAPAADLAVDIDPFRPAPATRVVFGDIRGALEGLGINWVPAAVLHEAFNPHPDLAHLAPENVFVTAAGGATAFNRRDPITSGLQELLLPYPGYLMPAGSGFAFEPLLRTSNKSGSSSFFDLVQPSPGGMVLNPSLTRPAGNQSYVLAARIRSPQPLEAVPDARPVNLVAVADLDFISDYFFTLRAAAPANVLFDNVTFFLNAVDLLAGDESFVALRQRRARHRTLTRLDEQTRTFVERRTREERQAEQEAAAALEDARRRVRERLAAIDRRTDLDAVARQIVVRNLAATENRQLDVLAARIDEAKRAKIRASRDTMEAEVRRIRTNIRTLAVLLPPLPILIAGAVIFLRRTRREREGARALGRLREVV